MEELGNGYYRSDKGKKVKRYSAMSPEEKEIHRKRTHDWRERNWNRALCMRLAVRAKNLGVPFNLEPNDIIIPALCPVLGIPLKRNATRWQSDSPSVDRIIPKLGYVKGNILIVSNKANRIKSDATYLEILQVGEFYKDLIEGQSKAA